MSGEKVASLIALFACLFLATRAWTARSTEFSWTTKAGMVAVWVVLIAVLALVMGRFR